MKLYSFNDQLEWSSERKDGVVTSRRKYFVLYDFDDGRMLSVNEISVNIIEGQRLLSQHHGYLHWHKRVQKQCKY